MNEKILPATIVASWATGAVWMLCIQAYTLKPNILWWASIGAILVTIFWLITIYETYEMGKKK